MGSLSCTRYVTRWRNMGWSKGRESYGHGVTVVVVGVTPHQGIWENHIQGKGWQVIRC